MTKVLMYTLVKCDSGRLPNKPVLDFAGKPPFVHTLERALEAYPNPDYVAVVTPKEMVNDPVELIAKQYGYDVVRTWKCRPHEQMYAYQHYGLHDDDITIGPPGDAPLSYTKHLPFGVECMEEYGADFVLSARRPGTLAQAFWSTDVQRVGYQRRLFLADPVWQDGTSGASRRYRTRGVIMELPTYLQAPWPWGPIHLDWPLQAVALRGIYEELYDGKPIDIRDVYDLYVRDPLLAELVPVDAPLANQPTFPGSADDVHIRRMKNTGNYVEVKFEEGGEEADNLPGKCVEQKNRVGG